MHSRGNTGPRRSDTTIIVKPNETTWQQGTNYAWGEDLLWLPSKTELATTWSCPQQLLWYDAAIAGTGAAWLHSYHGKLPSQPNSPNLNAYFLDTVTKPTAFISSISIPAARGVRPAVSP